MHEKLKNKKYPVKIKKSPEKSAKKYEIIGKIVKKIFGRNPEKTAKK